MRLSGDIYEFIKLEAAHVIQQQNVCRFPIDPFELAKQMGFEIVDYSTLSPSALEEALRISPDGFFIAKGTREYIFINDNVQSDRRRMTIFHEIGHPVLGHDDNEINAERNESEAKFFGKYLAAPPPLIHLKKSFHPLLLQSHFGISVEASYYALGYYKKWRSSVAVQGLQEYDRIILNQFGVKSETKLWEFEKSVVEGVIRHA